MTFTILEKDLCERIGINRDIFREFRLKHLTEYADWEINAGQVFLSEDAAKKTLRHIELQITQDTPQDMSSSGKASTHPSEPLMGALKQSALFPDEKRQVSLMVCTLYRNPRIIGALNPEDPDKKVLRVRVKNSKNFIKGMKIPCRHVKNDLWDLVGRCPRSRGRW